MRSVVRGSRGWLEVQEGGLKGTAKKCVQFPLWNFFQCCSCKCLCVNAYLEASWCASGSEFNRLYESKTADGYTTLTVRFTGTAAADVEERLLVLNIIYIVQEWSQSSLSGEE